MRWMEWRYDIALLISAGCLLKSVVVGTTSWPFVIFVILLFSVREARRLIPEPRNPAKEQYDALHQRIDQLADKVGRLELANGLRPKGRTE